MAIVTTAAEERGVRAEAYASSEEHLFDELRRLSLRLEFQVFQQRSRQPSGALDGLKGILLSEGEIDDILAASARFWESPAQRLQEDPNCRSFFDALTHLEAQIQARLEASAQAGIRLSWPRLVQLFGLSRLEQECLLVALAPELQPAIGTIYAYLQDDVTRRRPSVDFILELLVSSLPERWSARALFGARAPLRKHRLVELLGDVSSGSIPLSARTVRADDRIVDFVLEIDSIDERLASSVAPVAVLGGSVAPDVASDELEDRLRAFLAARMHGAGADSRNVLITLSGPDGAGRRSMVERVVRSLGLGLLTADLGRMVASPCSFAEQMERLAREGQLRSAALCLTGLGELLADERHASSFMAAVLAVASASPLTFLLGRDPWRPEHSPSRLAVLALELPLPDESARVRLWRQSLETHLGSTVAPEAATLASKFRFTPGQIESACLTARDLARWRAPADGHVRVDDLAAACRLQSNANLGASARKVACTFTWDDIVLPNDRLEQLRELHHAVAYRSVVHGAWGFGQKLARAKGISALFAGPSGTGKTLAAEIIAHQLGFDLLKIDLAVVVSKYIGETEKNLSRVFAEAEAANAVLLFDEADSLFGKRSEVKDAHDRYANIEVGYLLQKMEDYQGIVILATNLRRNMDEAFLRRLQFVVEFPFPVERDRRRIWEGVWPADAPRDPDVDLDVLARRYELTGGNIRNIAMGAAFLAASEGRAIAMSHLLRATRREYQKLGKVLMSDEFGVGVDERRQDAPGEG